MLPIMLNLRATSATSLSLSEKSSAFNRGELVARKRKGIGAVLVHELVGVCVVAVGFAHFAAVVAG